MDLPDRFASFLDTKIRDVLDEVKIEVDVFNGSKMVN
jgi:hypothetical protein